MRLFHFSDDPGITRFVPRPVATPSVRPPGREWLNGPLVWAIDEPHAPMYLFPRDCPRILMWPVASTTAGDRERWLGGTAARIVAFVEEAWRERLGAASIHRYELPSPTFEDLGDAGMHVSRVAVEPIGLVTVHDLPAALAASGTELRVVESLSPLRAAWGSSLHVSGIRLRHAKGW